VDDVEGWRETLDAGNAGGPMDVRAPPTEGRDLAATPTPEVRALEGVPVREVAALDVAVDVTCFVGDLVGDYNDNTVSNAPEPCVWPADE
jgi:hypothetical protein